MDNVKENARKKDLISVIIPCYHGDRYLNGLIEMMQRNAEALWIGRRERLEVLLVNDSPDEPLTLREANMGKQSNVGSPAGQGPSEAVEDVEQAVATAGFEGADGSLQLRMITNAQNMGIHASRVNGLLQSSGGRVVFLDQDDRISDDCILSQAECLGEADLVIGNGWEGQPNGEKTLIFTSMMQQTAAGDISCHYYYNNLIRSPGQVMIRRTSVPQYWTEQILQNNGSDDAFLWILMLSHGAVAAFNPKTVYEHVYTGSNASSNDKAMLRSQLEVAEKLKGVASTRGMRAFRRRAQYYCTDGFAHRFVYLDVGVYRMIYSRKCGKMLRKG